MNTVVTNFAEWWSQPFKAEGSVTSWFLFTGVILVIIWLWTRVLNEAGHVIGGE